MSDESTWTFSIASYEGPCSGCDVGRVIHWPGQTALCEACLSKADEFDTEARRLLSDTAGRSWFQVERDVAAALRERAKR